MEFGCLLNCVCWTHTRRAEHSAFLPPCRQGSDSWNASMLLSHWGNVWDLAGILCLCISWNGSSTTERWSTDSPFPPNKLWFLNRFRSGFLEPWCYLANQPAFPPVLSGTIVMKDASSTEGVAQCTLNLENDTPTDVITVRKENLLFFGSSWEPTFRVPNQFIFGRNALNGSKLGARTGTEPVPCWWKRAKRDVRKRMKKEDDRGRVGENLDGKCYILTS